MTGTRSALARSTAYNQSGLLCQEYQDALDKFENSLRPRNPLTAKNYLRGALAFLRFLQDKWGAPSLEAISREHAQTFKDSLIEAGYSRATTRVVVISARVFCKRLIEVDVLKGVDPFEKVKLEAGDLPPIDVLHDEDVQAMVNVAKREKTTWGRRDVAAMLLLYSGGFRAAELLSITENGVDWRRSTVSIVGKGRKHREVAPGAVAMGALEKYLTARSRYLLGLRPHRRELLGGKDAPIWISRKGGHWQKGGLANMLQSRAEVAGVTRSVHPHAWRHSCATKLANDGMAEAELSDRFGWSPGSTMVYRYTRSSLRERQIKRSQQLAPGNAIKL